MALITVAKMAAELGFRNLTPDIDETTQDRPVFTQAQMDSTLWVTQHGWPSMWQPIPVFAPVPYVPSPLLVHNSED